MRSYSLGDETYRAMEQRKGRSLLMSHFDNLKLTRSSGPAQYEQVIMDDSDSEYERSRSQTRFPSSAGFLALVPGTEVLNYRGQALQSLIQSRSTTHLPQLGQDIEQRPMTPSSGEFAPPIRRRSSIGFEALNTPQMRSMRLIGNANPRYKWQQYFRTEEELKRFPKALRRYYERNNSLIAQYLYIDKLLDSSLPQHLIEEYQRPIDIPATITEESHSGSEGSSPVSPTHTPKAAYGATEASKKIVRTPKALYRLPSETSPLLADDADDEFPEIEVDLDLDEDVDSDDPIVTVAIAINFAANTTLLLLKIAAAVLTSSLSVLASLVDAALDFLSTAIVWFTARLISSSSKDPYGYPAGRRRLEPIGVLVFGVIMITSFVQVGIESVTRLTSGSREVVYLTIPAISIMAATVVIKLACWFWCRLVKNSSVQALAEDAMTDVVFNTFSIIFPLLGYWLQIWWLDAAGGLFLSFYVIFNWSRVTASHIRNLSGAAADADRRNVLLYLTMRFARTIKQIQGMTAYHAGDKLICEVDIVLDEATPLRDTHDLGESLQYVLESVPYVDRAFVHMDYRSDNLPSHMDQHGSNE